MLEAVRFPPPLLALIAGLPALRAAITTKLFNTGGGPSFCTVDSTGRWVYTSDNPSPPGGPDYSYIRRLDTQSTPASPTYTNIAGGATGYSCNFDGPALGNGFVCFAIARALELDATERYLYFTDTGNNMLRVLDLQVRACACAQR